MATQSPVVIAIATAVALLAAGTGVAAWWKLHRDRRPKVVGRLWLADTPYYSMTKHSKSPSHVLEPTPVLAAYPRGAVRGAATQPTLRIDVTNTRDRTISVNEVELVFSDLAEDQGGAVRPGGTPDAQPTPCIAVSFRDGQGGDAHRVVAAAFDLIVDRVHDRTVRYRLRQPASPSEMESLARRIARHEAVTTAIPDVVGEPHSPWGHAEVVQLRLEQHKFRYQYFVGHTVPARESLTIPIAVGSETALTGTTVIRLLLDGAHTQEIAVLRIHLAPPAGIAVLQEGNDDGADEG